MVFESIAVHYLEKYLGDYIQNLDSKKLKIGLWHGNVVLENLDLKPDALANFNLPVTIVTGYIQKLSLHISWKHIHTHPIRITIDGFYVLLEPNTEVKYDAERAEKEQYDAKMKEVHKVEEIRKKREEYQTSEKSPKNKDTFLERLKLHIIRNLELSISNIHIAFEDKTTKPDHPFSFGITLNYIKLHTTNDEWEHVTSREHSPVVYKFGEVNTLSIYGNSNIKPRSVLSKENIIDDLHAKIARNDESALESLTYILQPLNIEVKLKIAITPHKQHFAHPVLDAKIDLGQINLNINRNQYSNLLDLFEFQDYFKLQSKYIKYQLQVENDDMNKPSRRRWKFAYAAILNEQVRPRLAYYKWENIKATLDQCGEYHTLHLKELTGHATKHEKLRAEELEKQMSGFNLIFIRRTTELEVKKKKAEHKQKSWRDTLSSCWSENSDSDNPEYDPQNAMTTDETNKLHDAIGYEDDHTSSSYPEEFIDIDLSIRLNLFEVNVWSSINENDSQFKMIARATIVDTGLTFQRRPATSDFVLVVDMGSLEVYGHATDDNRPALIQPTNRSQVDQQKLLHIEFETNPLNRRTDYRIQAISQSLKITYDALTINKLIECFYPGVHRDLKGVKKTVYSFYTDIKHQTQFLLSYNLKNIKALDIDIDLQSSCFLLPENGAYRSDCSAICLDFGHFTVKGGRNNIDNEEDGTFQDARDHIDTEEDGTFQDAQTIDDIRESPYIPLVIRLENVQLLYAKQNEDWKNARNERDSLMHLIKPITLHVDVFKCLYTDDTTLPLWKIDAQVSEVHARLSDSRLFGVMKLIQSIPFPKSIQLSSETQTDEKLSTSSQTFDTIENMTPVKKILREVENEEATVDSKGQFLELEAVLKLPRIDLLIEESLSDSPDGTQPFVRISFVSIAARTTIKTFDIEFDASLADLIIVHEQFLTNNNKPLRLFSTTDNDQLISAKCLFTSSENPLFYSPPYSSIENKVRVHISKALMMLQVEALASILRFQHDLMERLSKLQQDKKETPERLVSKSNSSENVQKKSLSVMSTFLIEADLEAFRAIIGTEVSQILDIQLESLTVNATQAARKTSVRLILNDFRILDPHTNSRYRTIIVPQGHEKPILCVDFSRFNHSKIHEKELDDVDCDIKIQFAKMNIVFLYKYVDLIMNILNTFKMKKTKEPDISSTETKTTSDTVQRFQEQAFKIRFDVLLNAPTILIPVNSHSDEAVFIDLGQSTLNTHFLNDPHQSFVEQQVLIFKNLLVSRVKLNDNNEILGDVVLLECAEFHTMIDRLLDSGKIKNEPKMLVKIRWETIDFNISKDDYSCMMNIVKENFPEKIHSKIPQPAIQEQDNVFPDVAVKKKNDLSDVKMSAKIQLDFEIKRIALTLYLGGSNLTVPCTPRDKSLKFANVRIEMLNARFQQRSDSSYNAEGRIQNILLDDLRATDPPNSITRLIDRNFTKDPNSQMLVVTVEFKPKTETNTTAVRQVNAQLESLYCCLSSDCLMTLKDFLTPNQLSDSEAKSNLLIVSSQSQSEVSDDLPAPAKRISTHHQSNDQLVSASTSSKPISKQASSDTKSDIQTSVDVLIKTSQIILLENQQDANSNCLVLVFDFQMQTITAREETNAHGGIKSLTLYGTNFAELKDSRIQYHILQPIAINFRLIMNSEYQKVDIRIGDIAVNITPAAIHTIYIMANSIGKVLAAPEDEKEKINSKSLFDPKPFKDASFWFIDDTEVNQQMIEHTDILEITTGTPSHKKAVVQEKVKQEEAKKKSQTEKLRSQQFIFNLKIIEVKLELDSGSTTKSVFAICLSDLFLDVKNWSTEMNICAKIQIELALFNDHILAWEPLIEPIIDERGEVISPWCITCSTIPEEDEIENEYPAERRSRKRFKHRFLGKHRKTEEQRKDSMISVNAKNRIDIRAEHLLSITLTKTSIDLAQRLSKMFNNAFTKQVTPREGGDKAILSVHNLTGYEILIDKIVGVEFAEKTKYETSVNLKHEESVPLTVPGERLIATHLPAIAEQVAKRRQEFSVKIADSVAKVDINQTWHRVYELSPSCVPDWPIQMLCDSQIYNDRRRVILSSIVKIYNRTITPLVILDVDSIEIKQYHQVARLEVNEEYYLPIHLLYMRSSPRLFIGIDEGDGTEQINDFLSFDWSTESTADRILKLQNGKEAHIVVYKESIAAYSENTDEPIRTCFHIYVKLALHLINLLPIDLQCSIDSDNQIDLKTSELYHSTSGTKKSLLIFTIPSYNNAKWISEPVDLKLKGHGKHNEHIVQFHDVNTQDILRMVLRVDTYRESYRASLYSPFWVLNCTDLKFEFKVDHDKTFIDAFNSPFFVCPKKFDSETHKKKGHIRLYSIEQDDTVSQWSEGFSLDVIKSTGMTSCKVMHDRTYMICIETATSSFGMSEIIILTPSMSIINNSTVEIEVVETVCGIEQDDWKPTKPGEIIPFWPRDIQEGVMCVRYAHNRAALSAFKMNDKHRTLLRMDDDERPAIHVEVTITDFYGIHVVFGDYKIGDAPVLLVNCLRNQPVTFCQGENLETSENREARLLPPQHYVYYTWIDPLEPQELGISCNGQNTTVELNPLCGILKIDDDEQTVYYTVFHDGPQMVLIFSDERSICEAVSDTSSLDESMSQYVQISIRDIGISVINDITRDDLFYITINKSKHIWTETRKSVVQPLSSELNHDLEKHYKTHTKHLEANTNDTVSEETKYHIGQHRDVSFNDDTAELVDHKGHRIKVKRKILDGLWVALAWSASNATFHVRINHIQIDDQLEYSIFPVILYPIVSKAAGTDMPGKPFIELIIFKSKVARSKMVHFKYFKLLIQEFVVRADQGLLLSIFAFVRSKKDSAAPTISMDTDLQRIAKPLEMVLKSQVDNQSKDTKIYFDNIHLSPLKIHVSFSMHGSKPSEQLLTEYPLADFLLQLLNLAEVEDVILKLNFYERKKDRFTITSLTKEVETHYEHQLLKQLYVVVLGLDVLGNPFGVIRGVAGGVHSFFYEPYKGAMEGPIEFIEGIASGTEDLVGSTVGGAAGAVSRITGVISKSLATLTFDEDYQSARIQRKELTTSDVVQSGKNIVKDTVHGVKDVVKKPVAGARKGGAPGFIKGLGKGFLGLVARPTSGVADLTSTSLGLVKRIATHEEVVHRVRHPRHVGRDGIVRPSTAYETAGFYIFNRLDLEKYTKADDCIAHIACWEDGPGWLMATTKHLMFVTEKSSSPSLYEVEWHFQYKELKGAPVVKFDPHQIVIILKEPKLRGIMKKGLVHEKIVACQNAGEARYIVDKITRIMHALEL